MQCKLNRRAHRAMANSGMQWKACGHVFEFPPTMVMGIVNLTPDSFFDGGRHLDTKAAFSHALKLVKDGAGRLDIGGESTRPGAMPVDETEEINRIVPIIKLLVAETDVPISVDTQKPAVAKAAIAAGAIAINDIAANRKDDTMRRIVSDTGAGYILMHMQGTPQTMQNRPEYDDVSAEVEAFFQERLERLDALGIDTAQVVLDPGIGFGKTAVHNLELLAKLERFIRLGRPLLLGASRKSFLGGVVSERLPGSLACAVHAMAAGVNIVRVHDVRETEQAVKTVEAILSS